MTTFEAMVLNETFKRESSSKVSWAQQHASEAPFATKPCFPLDSQEYQKIDNFRSKVADLCDLQPTPVGMLRPKRKVTPRRTPRLEAARPRADSPARAFHSPMHSRFRPHALPADSSRLVEPQDALKELKKELEGALGEVETQLDAMGGSEYTQSVKSMASAKSLAKSERSVKSMMSTVTE